jgi:ferredoxin-NADP reductase
MTNSNNKMNVLHAVEGYHQALEHKAQLEHEGTDYTEQRGKVASTIAKLHPKRLSLEVAEIIEDTPSTKTLRLVSLGLPLPPFQAGQYINLFVNIDGVETARPYAISSAPLTRGHYDLTVKRVADGFVSHFLLDEVKVGDQFESTGPMGTFYHNPVFHGTDLVFLAGGSGIAPARSMIKDIADRGLSYRFHLIYGSSYVDDVIFDEELKALEQAYDFLKVTKIISRPPEGYSGKTGHLTASIIESLVGSLDNKMFYVCGPTSFHEFCEAQLAELNVKARRVRVECNGPPKHPETLEGWPKNLAPDQEVQVTIRGKGTFTARVDEPLLNSMERNGFTTENACRSGECSLCRVKVTKGQVFNPPEAHLRESDSKYGWCHSCVAFPTEDLEIIV